MARSQEVGALNVEEFCEEGVRVTIRCSKADQ
jgi:hypothetical protein